MFDDSDEKVMSFEKENKNSLSEVEVFLLNHDSRNTNSFSPENSLQKDSFLGNHLYLPTKSNNNFIDNEKPFAYASINNKKMIPITLEEISRRLNDNFSRPKPMSYKRFKDMSKLKLRTGLESTKKPNILKMLKNTQHISQKLTTSTLRSSVTDGKLKQKNIELKSTAFNVNTPRITLKDMLKSKPERSLFTNPPLESISQSLKNFKMGRLKAFSIKSTLSQKSKEGETSLRRSCAKESSKILKSLKGEKIRALSEKNYPLQYPNLAPFIGFGGLKSNVKIQKTPFNLYEPFRNSTSADSFHKRHKSSLPPLSRSNAFKTQAINQKNVNRGPRTYTHKDGNKQLLENFFNLDPQFIESRLSLSAPREDLHYSDYDYGMTFRESKKKNPNFEIYPDFLSKTKKNLAYGEPCNSRFSNYDERAKR